MRVNGQGLLQGRADSQGSVCRGVRSWRQVNAGNEPQGGFPTQDALIISHEKGTASILPPSGQSSDPECQLEPSICEGLGLQTTQWKALQTQDRKRPFTLSFLSFISTLRKNGSLTVPRLLKKKKKKKSLLTSVALSLPFIILLPLTPFPNSTLSPNIIISKKKDKASAVLLKSDLPLDYSHLSSCCPQYIVSEVLISSQEYISPV